MPYIIYHPNGDVTMPDELPLAEKVNEQIEPEPTQGLPETEEIDDIEDELNAAFSELFGRLDACEHELAALRGERHGTEERTETTHTESVADRDPTATHFWFREIGRKHE